MKRAFRFGCSALAISVAASLSAADDTKKDSPRAETGRKPAEAGKNEERKPSEGAPRGERKPDGANPRGAGQPRDGGGRRSEFPAEIKLTDEQELKLTELRTEYGGKFAELSQKRDAILTDEQKTARTEVEKKLREGGVGRQEYADAMAAALKLTLEQKTKIEAVEAEAGDARKQWEAARLGLLSAEQKTKLRKLSAEREIERMFQLPGELNVTDEQTKGLKSLQDELAPELKSLTEKRDAIMTEERKSAQQAVMKEAQDSNKDRQALAEALDSALKLTDAEKSELRETQGKLGELFAKIQERKLALLTPEQKQEFEKKFGSRGR